MKTLHASALMVLGLASLAGAQHGQAGPQPPAAPLDWKKLESPVLQRQVQLTRREQFVKAGEAYFSPDARWIIFQAVPVPAEGGAPDPFYSMYVARLIRDTAGHIIGTETPLLVSPPGSANTCGWFHPTEPWRVLFGSTLVKPSDNQKAGFQVGLRKYVWLFPEETEVCTRLVPEIYSKALEEKGQGYRQELVADLTARSSDAAKPVPVFSRRQYDAECSYSADGRFVLYAHVRSVGVWAGWGFHWLPRNIPLTTGGRPDADIWIYDTQTQQHHAIVTADGYDGGPFFSPEGKRICYRSDRKLNDLLQLFVADLKFQDGVPVGIEREYQLTDNSAVNWAPYWHPSGKFLVYGTSEISHMNYEVFAIELDPVKLGADAPDRRASETLSHRRITSADGADILPVFDQGGKLMMWTSQRGPMIDGEQRPSSQLWIAEFNAAKLKFAE